MSTSGILGYTLLGEGLGSQEVRCNENLAYLEQAAILKILDRDLTAPPGSPAEMDAYLVATGATGGWIGQDGKIAFNQNESWHFFSPYGGMHCFVHDEKIDLFYSSAESEWFCPYRIYSTTETWTGQYDVNGAKLYQKTVDIGALPNSTTANTAHGITGLDVTERIEYNGWATNGTTINYPLPYISAGNNVYIYFDATNIKALSNFDASSLDGEIWMKYTKT